MRNWWAKKSLDEKRELIARRDPERVRAADRARSRGNPERNRGRKRDPEKQLEHGRRARELYPEKFRARKKVTTEILAGRLVRQPCEVCGAEPVQAHHDDYDRPLDVRWLCSVHHGEVHRLPDVEEAA